MNAERGGDARYFWRYRELIPDYDDFLASLRNAIPTTVRANTLMGDPDKIWKNLRRRGIILTSTPLGDHFRLVPGLDRPGCLLEHLMGLIYTQTLASAVPPLVLDPKPGDCILDLCAAPGSKTTQMAQQMANTGRIIANEPVKARHPALQSNLRRLGVTNTLVTAYYGQNFPMRRRFSKILVDAPCSGEGNARINAQGEWVGHTPGHRRFQKIQEALLVKSFDLLEENGQLVYSTCTYNPLENEAVISALLDARPARIMAISLDLPHDNGITSWQGDRYHAEVANAWRIYPHRMPTVGFFLAKIGRT
jgi:NOL1/NOP2/sun family putative RNA methylase